MAHFDFALHQMDVKTSFLNSDFEEEVYVKQSEGFFCMVIIRFASSKSSMYQLKQASRQWYLKIQDIISLFAFVENIMDQYAIRLVAVIFLVLYVDDILLCNQ